VYGLVSRGRHIRFLLAANVCVFLTVETFTEGYWAFGQIAEPLEEESAHEAYSGHLCRAVAALLGV
jgi:hypothetical protein